MTQIVKLTAKQRCTIVAGSCPDVPVNETVQIPPHHYGEFYIRKSHGSKGVDAPKCIFHAGWEGTPQLTLIHKGANDVDLLAGEEIGELHIRYVVPSPAYGDLNQSDLLSHQHKFIPEKGKTVPVHSSFGQDHMLSLTKDFHLSRSGDEIIASLNYQSVFSFKNYSMMFNGDWGFGYDVEDFDNCKYDGKTVGEIMSRPEGKTVFSMCNPKNLWQPKLPILKDDGMFKNLPMFAHQFINNDNYASNEQTSLASLSVRIMVIKAVLKLIHRIPLNPGDTGYRAYIEQWVKYYQAKLQITRKIYADVQAVREGDFDHLKHLTKCLKLENHCWNSPAKVLEYLSKAHTVVFLDIVFGERNIDTMCDPA